VLSEALPPIDEHDVATVAEGFERLDRRKEELKTLAGELDEVRALARAQRDYARAVIVGAAGGVRSAESKRDEVTRGERVAGNALADARVRALAAGTERIALADRIDAIDVDVTALKDSDAYRQGAGLAELGQRATAARSAAGRAAVAAAEWRDDHGRARTEIGEALEHRTTAEGNLDLAVRGLRELADGLGARSVVGEAELVDDPDESAGLVRAWVESQRARIAEVRTALAAHEKSVAQRDFLSDQVDRDEQAAEHANAALGQATAAADGALVAYAEAVEAWAAGCTALDAPTLLAAIRPVITEPVEVAAAVALVVGDAHAAQAAERERLAAARTAATEERAELVDERARWAEGALIEPPGPSWRGARDGLAGAPLWRLVDVADGVAAAEVDGLEAALTGAGLLDAWVQPDGAVDLAGRADVVLTSRPSGGTTLASLLTPAPDVTEAGVVPDVVAQVLGSIAVGDLDTNEVAVAVDGSFRLGAAFGRGDVRPASQLGAVARERHRLAELARLDGLLAEIDRRLADLDRADADLDRRRVAVGAEAAALPSGDDVATTRADVARAATTVDNARAQLDRSRAARRDAEEAVRAALLALTRLAQQHGLPSDRDLLAQVDADLERLRDAVAAWGRRRVDLAHATRAHERAAAAVDLAAARLASAEAEQHRAEQEAHEAEQRVATLEAAIGAEYAEITRRIAALDAERITARERREELYAEEIKLQRREAELETQLAAAVAVREAAEEERVRTHRRFIDALAELAVDATITSPVALANATEILAAARAVAADHERVDGSDQAVERLAERVSERAHAANAKLQGRVDVDRELADPGWWVLRTTANGLRWRATELARALATQLEEGEAELLADEERLFEQTLAGSVRRALADRIRQANALVDSINAQLGKVVTHAGGVAVRLRWDVDSDQPAVVKSARTLLLQDYGALSERDQQALQQFVRARVDQARAELEASASWDTRLRETLDYRRWHRFTLQLAHRDWEGFQPATARRLQRLSTGERSIALHLPMIASVAAHYAGDDDKVSICPRLILLDELFAGVDTANRSQLFGTFTTWDLDAVFTSDHEWCQYESLDGIAIHHLHPPAGDEPVTSTRFTWDGARRELDPSAA
jgi:uncharacterized protein (TIGR02680 family)